jgi:hypothetical protein
MVLPRLLDEGYISAGDAGAMKPYVPCAACLCPQGTALDWPSLGLQPCTRTVLGVLRSTALMAAGL